MQIVITCRAIIIHENKLLMCNHDEPGRSFYNLPGGKLDAGETISDCIARELVEETGVAPVVGKILFINQFINSDNHRIEFFYNIENGLDYANFDPTKASHGFEVAKFALADPTDPQYDIRPNFLVARFGELLAQGHKFQTEVTITS